MIIMKLYSIVLFSVINSFCLSELIGQLSITGERISNDLEWIRSVNNTDIWSFQYQNSTRLGLGWTFDLENPKFAFTPLISYEVGQVLQEWIGDGPFMAPIDVYPSLLGDIEVLRFAVRLDYHPFAAVDDGKQKLLAKENVYMSLAPNYSKHTFYLLHSNNGYTSMKFGFDFGAAYAFRIFSRLVISPTLGLRYSPNLFFEIFDDPLIATPEADLFSLTYGLNFRINLISQKH